MKSSRFLLNIRPVVLILPLFLLAAPVLAESVRGTAFGPQGRVVPEARVMLMLDYVKQKETNTDRQGSFEFTGVTPGRYELRIKRRSSHRSLHSKFTASSVLPDPL